MRPFALPDAEIYAKDIVERVVTHWAAQARHIIATLQGRVRRYEGDFEAYKGELFAELENLRYKPGHDPES
jgi:hypothetical protein